MICSDGWRSPSGGKAQRVSCSSTGIAKSYRSKAGEAPNAQEYIQLLPEHDGLIRRVFLDVSGESLHRFKREFRALADVNHPNLVGLRTLENDGGQWFITLDLLDGCDFLSFVRPTGYQSDITRLRAGLGQLAAGLMALHARGIIHRDLKPGNVMVTTRGRVVILDFGLVSELDRAGVISATGLVAGTPAYMAPEQAAGGQVGPPADWYAFGVMLYEAISGNRPFFGDSWRILQDKQQQDAPPLSSNPPIPMDLGDLCSKLLARNPKDRPDPLQIAGVVASVFL